MQTHVYLSSNRYRQTLTDEDGEPVNGATVTLTLLDGTSPDAAEVVGEEWPVELDDNGDGTYDYTPPVDLLTLGRKYLAVTDADLAGVKAHSVVRVRCAADMD